MPVPAIKICGLSTAETLEAAIAARADYAGFVFVAGSPRHVTLDAARALGTRAAGRIARVGLFVDADDWTIAEALGAAQLDVLQLHGSETPAQTAALRTRFGVPVWKALPVATAADLARAADFAGAADLVLLDARTPKGSLPGGAGLAFDWTVLTGWRPPCPWGLAGGLSAANLAAALATTRASLVDVSSGVESAPGVKDPDLIAAFCAAARRG
jgi:phosphoribosylanthranilate isomerase